MDSSDDGRLDLQAAADALGVHYQTAYRWVRTGRLPATLIAGRYVVAPHDLSVFDEVRNTPKTPAAPSRPRMGRAADRVHDALVSGDEKTAVEIARKLTNEGSSIVDLIQEVFVPSLRRIGQAWHDGQLTIWAEHRAAAIVERILGELAPNPRGRRRGTALVAAVSGDHHALPTTMAAAALRDDNWHVEHLGADLPPEEITQFCVDHDVSVAVITVTTATATQLARDTAHSLRLAGTPTIVGAPGRTLAELIGEARQAVAR